MEKVRPEIDRRRFVMCNTDRNSNTEAAETSERG